jgi:hypothetical protein
MGLIENIRTFIGDYFFKQEYLSQKRDVIVNNIDAVSEVGIIFYADSEESYRVVSKFILLLKKEGVREVKMLGFVSEKQMPAFLSPRLGQDFFMKKDLNWHMKPVSTAVLNFIHEPFDILIDLSEGENFPLKYILGKSQAHFKVGKGGSGRDFLLDMMINTGEQEGLEFLTKQILHYLRQINKIDGDVLAMLK